MNTENTIRRVAIVTGAAGALGSEICRKLAADGLDLVLTDIDAGVLDAVAETLLLTPGQRAIVVQADMGSVASIENLVAQAAAVFGRIDVVVNNAAVNHRGAIRDFDPDKWDHMMAVNLRGPAVLCQRVAPFWDRQKSGRVVNIASRSWVAGGPPAYVACKAGLVGLTRSLARELAPSNVTSNAIAPGLVPSAFTMDGRSEELFNSLAERSTSQTPLGRLTTPQDIANTVSFLVSPGAGYITGEVIHVCGGSQLAPLGGANNN